MPVPPEAYLTHIAFLLPTGVVPRLPLGRNVVADLLTTGAERQDVKSSLVVLRVDAIAIGCFEEVHFRIVELKASGHTSQLCRSEKETIAEHSFGCGKALTFKTLSIQAFYHLVDPLVTSHIRVRP